MDAPAPTVNNAFSSSTPKNLIEYYEQKTNSITRPFGNNRLVYEYIEQYCFGGAERL